MSSFPSLHGEKPEFLGPDQTNPHKFIMSFCRDYRLWNDFAVKSTQDSSGTQRRQIMADLQKLYEYFLQKFISNETKLQLISFGSHSTFNEKMAVMTHTESFDKLVIQHFHTLDNAERIKDKFFAEIEEADSGILTLNQIYYVDPYPDYPPHGQGPFLPIL